MVIIGRPYNSADAGANLNIHKKLINLGVYPIPMDMLPLDDMSDDDRRSGKYVLGLWTENIESGEIH